MFEDRNMMKFIYVLLGVASIIIPGPIVPIVSFVIAISMLMYRIKQAKESPESFELLMFEIIIIIIVIIVDIGIFTLRFSIENDYNFSSNSKQEMSITELAENIIVTYKLENFSQFSSNINNQNAIKKGLVTYLKDELEITDTSVNGNKVTCKIGDETIIFTVTKNDIKYTTK